LDLDGFKPINDRYGHEAGDQLLNALSKRLQNTLRGNDTLARLGGDEFVLLIGDLNATEECDYALNRTLAEVISPFDIKGTPVTVSASIGVTLYPLDDVDGDTLLRQADHAMYRAKQLGKNRYQLFDPQRDRELKNRRDQMQALLNALRHDEFVLHYQPKVNLLDGTVIGAEALIRWQHPEKGLLYPGLFLDLFSGPELESELGQWVLGSALKQIDNWQRQKLVLKISVNISANHLLSKNFVDHLQTLLSTYPSINPNQLELEVLETAAMDDMQRAVEIMSRCKALGVSFALDDFGTGYSSLAYFRRLPVDILKIDQGFVRDMLIDQEDFTIVESVVRLAQAFNRPVIAEGVETLDHAAKLLKLGCILAQGYGIAKPMAAEALENWIANWQQQATWQALEIPSLPIKDLPLLLATQNHKSWLEQLLQHLKNPKEQSLPPLSSQQCSFGYWCHGSGRNHYGHWREFQAIDLVHERIHQLAAELIEEINHHDTNNLTALKAELENLCELMLNQLQDLMQKVSNQYPDSSQHLAG
jgi:diguanylate cyclase (GGDEF)-like protein